MEINLEQEIKEKQNIVKFNRKLVKCFKELVSQLDKEGTCADQ